MSTATGEKRPEIDEVITFLEDFDTQAIEELRAEFPDYAPLLFSGKMLGEKRDAQSNPNEIFVRATVCKKGLEVLLHKVEETVPVLKKRLKNLGRIQFASQVIIGTGGASLITQSSDTIPFLQPIAGMFALTGSVLTLYAQHKSGTLSNSPQSIFHFYDKLIDGKFEAEQLLQDLDLMLYAFEDKSLAAIAETVSRGNQVCLEIRKALEKI